MSSSADVASPSWKASLASLAAPVRWLCLVTYLAAVLRVAWVSDDAFITLDAVENLLSGYGLLHNPPERVQGFSNPLWALLLIPVQAALREPYYAVLLLSVTVSAAAAWLLAYRVARRDDLGAGALLLMLASEAFLDYSTSGLENPLSCLLLALFCLVLFRDGPTKRRVIRLFVLGALLAVNRLDNVLLVAPALAYELARARSLRAIGWASLGLLPLWLWLLFALGYYGFFLPNTYYAKLNSDISFIAWLGQGLSYLVDSVSRDPVTLLTTLFVVGVGLTRRGFCPEEQPPARTAARRAFAAGLLLYLLYVVRVGGDFMAGRFLVVPFYGALLLLVREIGPRWSVTHWVGLAVAATLVIATIDKAPANVELVTCRLTPSGIVDERVCYQEHTALIHNLQIKQYQQHKYWIEGWQHREQHDPAFRHYAAGMAGYASGPKSHLIDENGLTDPLLARIEHKADPTQPWRVGHLRRVVPAGYEETVATGQNQLADPCLRQYYDRLSLVTRGPIFSGRRLAAIFAFQVGAYDHLLQPSCKPD